MAPGLLEGLPITVVFWADPNSWIELEEPCILLIHRDLKLKYPSLPSSGKGLSLPPQTWLEQEEQYCREEQCFPRSI